MSAIRSQLRGHLPVAILLAGSLAWLAARVAAIYSTAFNWDEFVLFDRAARSLQDGVLRGGGHGGLAELIVMPLLSACSDEIAVGRHARLVWLGISLLILAGVGLLVRELLRGRPQARHDMWLAVAAFACLPVILEWMLQVRSDHLAVAGGVWGGALLLVSRRRLGFAGLAGLAFAIGWLSSQKLAYLALLMLCLEVGTLLLTRDLQPRREALRAFLLCGVAFALTHGYRLAVSLLLVMRENHPTSPLPDAAWVSGYLDVFDFYRHTLGYTQHLAVLPSLLPHAIVLLGLAAASALALRRRDFDLRLPLAWGTLGLGFAVALFHAAAFSYFWLTLGVFLTVALALSLGPVRALLPPRWQPVAMGLLWCAVVASGLVRSVALLDDTQAVQRESLRFAERNFHPEDPGFHPEAGLFCNAQPLGTWLSQSIYRRVGAPEARHNIPRVIERFSKQRVHYLVESFRLRQFPPEIQAFFAEHYQPYRASVFVAGRRLAGAPGERLDFDLIVPGVYRWLPSEGTRAIRIDGQRLEPGATISLDTSPHRAEFDEAVRGGALVLAVNEPPGPAPLAFYKPY